MMWINLFQIPFQVPMLNQINFFNNFKVIILQDIQCVHIQRPRQRAPPLLPLRPRRACAVQSTQQLPIFASSTTSFPVRFTPTWKHFQIRHALRTTLLKTACRNSKWFNFYDLSKSAILSSRTGFSLLLFLLRQFLIPPTI